eukprot:maker-scaffold_75-snap-gene-0.66-mRNA-1 protein AED:0.58 eAED:0.60 QI:0/0/0/1/0/0/2/0/93
MKVIDSVVGESDGEIVGLLNGDEVDKLVGERVKNLDGEKLGVFEGIRVCSAVGDIDGGSRESDVGEKVGFSVDGDKLGDEKDSVASPNPKLAD